MSIQEMKSQLHLLIETVDNEPTLEQLLDTAKMLITKQPVELATLADLSATQRDRLEQAIKEHKEGKTVSHEEMKQRHRQWLNE